jgi:enoyl-CoA hydratase
MAATDPVHEPEILVTRENAAGVLVLNRPKALNALTHGMVREMTAALTNWETDSQIRRIIVKASGDRAFCAGGDIRAIHDLGKSGRRAEALSFFREEYRLNRQIKRYPKPYVALIDGIVMGGGVGVSVHGTYRVAGDRYSFAMPEVGIGFFPDVGGTYALPRLPFHAGTYLALTGARIGRADAIALGLATHAVASADLAAVEAALAAGDDIEATLKLFAAPSEEAPLLTHRALIERVFSLGSVAEIVAALAEDASPFAQKTLATIQAKSPTSLAIALEQMRRGAELSFEAAMALEMRIVTRVTEGHEFYEGVRAVIIDKDNAPRWEPAGIAAVTPEAIAPYFAPLDDELVF